MHTEHVQTKRQIIDTLKAAGLRPRKRFGQHFLIDGNLMRRLVASAELDPADLVLEVGGGTGGLTDLIASRVQQLICVEIDQAMHGVLQERFRGKAGVSLIHGDVLESKHRVMPDVGRAIVSHDGGPTGCVKLVANLPYQIATPLMMNLLMDYPQVRRLCFTVQAEVGERITSGPNCKAYGPLSIISQLLCSIQTVARLAPDTFWPRPAVDSIMIRMDVGEPPFSNRDELHRFTSLLRGTFEHRRKTLRSALKYVIEDAQRSRICRLFDATRRPESFTVEEWLGIFKALEP